jgi:PadR family transcriptional regulator PadR
MTLRKPDRGGDRVALLQGTLDLIVLRTLLGGTQHGQGIAGAIQRTSREALLVDHGSLYPALQRLEARKWIRATWGTTANNREARFYDLTALGRKQLVREVSQWKKLTQAVALILDPEATGG